MAIDIKKVSFRFVTTLFANVLRVALAFVTGVITARALGPSNYGDYMFLLGSFTSIATLVGMSTSSAFYTFISRKKRTLDFYLYYTAWLGAQFMILAALVFVLPEKIKSRIWLSHENPLIILALFASFSINQIWEFVAQIGESIRDTVWVQLRNATLAFLSLAGVIFLIWSGRMNLRSLFMLTIILYLGLSISYGYFLFKKRDFYAGNKESFKGVFNEFRSYCASLVVYTAMSFFHSFAGLWLLQKFGGATEQGFYGVAYKFAAVSLIATSSMLAIFWKEIADSHNAGDMDRVYELFRKTSRRLYFVGGVITACLLPFSRELMSFFLGAAYEGAWISLAIMLIFPLHQSLGQITGTMYLALGSTKLYSKIGIFVMTAGVISGYFLLASHDSFIPGFALGSMGMSINMVMWNIISVNILGFFILRQIGRRFSMKFQLYIAAVLLSTGYFCKFCSGSVLRLMSPEAGFIPQIAASSVMYGAAVAAIVYFFPQIVPLEKEEVKRLFTGFMKRRSL